MAYYFDPQIISLGRIQSQLSSSSLSWNEHGLSQMRALTNASKSQADYFLNRASPKKHLESTASKAYDAQAISREICILRAVESPD